MEAQYFMIAILNPSIKLGALPSSLLPWKVGVLQFESNCRLGPETGNKDGLTSLLAARLIHPFIFNPFPPALENCFDFWRKHSSGVVFSTIFLQHLKKVLAVIFLLLETFGLKRLPAERRRSEIFAVMQNSLSNFALDPIS